MKTAKEYATECFEALKSANDLNLSDGLMNPNPQIVNRIIENIERAILRHFEEHRIDLLSPKFKVMKITKGLPLPHPCYCQNYMCAGDCSNEDDDY